MLAKFLRQQSNLQFSTPKICCKKIVGGERYTYIRSSIVVALSRKEEIAKVFLQIWFVPLAAQTYRTVV